jgi:two-component system, LytTR family, sensor kinase
MLPKDPQARTKWGLIVFLWTLLGFISVLQTWFAWYATSRKMSWTSSFTLGMGYSLIWIVLTPLVLQIVRWFPIERHLLKSRLLIHLLASIGVGAFQRFAFVSVERLFYYSGERWNLWNAATRSIAVSIDYQIMIYWVILAIHEGIRYYSRYNEGQVRASQLETRLVQAQLQALKMQLNPHFLFNTLSAIAALIHVDPNAADQMLVRLSDLLRMSLDNAGAQEVPLEKELEFLQRYLEIEKVRFEDRLHVDLRLEPAVMQAKVPNLILQPLVENAIRHGLAKVTYSGRIRIEARRDGDNLRICVEDNGIGMKGEPVREGVGLASTRSRLQHLYGDAQTFLIRNLQGGGVQASITLPFQTA